MKIRSPAFENDALIPKKYTCEGEDINPPFIFEEIPENAKSLVFILHDPDAPIKDGFTHWVIFNIDPKTKEIPENSVPDAGIEAMTDAGKQGYIGPCPPTGTHRYFFKLYALDIVLDLNSSAIKKDVEEKMEKHILDSSELIGLYKKGTS